MEDGEVLVGGFGKMSREIRAGIGSWEWSQQQRGNGEPGVVRTLHGEVGVLLWPVLEMTG